MLKLRFILLPAMPDGLRDPEYHTTHSQTAMLGQMCRIA